MGCRKREERSWKSILHCSGDWRVWTSERVRKESWKKPTLNNEYPLSPFPNSKNPNPKLSNPNLQTFSKKQTATQAPLQYTKRIQNLNPFLLLLIGVTPESSSPISSLNIKKLIILITKRFCFTGIRALTWHMPTCSFHALQLYSANHRLHHLPESYIKKLIVFLLANSSLIAIHIIKSTVLIWLVKNCSYLEVPMNWKRIMHKGRSSIYRWRWGVKMTKVGYQWGSGRFD